MSIELIEHDPAITDQKASLEALEALMQRVREGKVRGYMIAMVCDVAGEDAASLKESVDSLGAFDMLALWGTLGQAQRYISESLTAGEPET